jgi:2-methylaconitate cis-trans-isomerase PrpF/tripartite-type tricarboxylate transporter receptor subunit TctC
MHFTLARSWSIITSFKLATTPMTMTTTIPCTLMRAGTSRGPFFLRDWLPEDPAVLEEALIGAIGASDPLQLDGLGGGSTLNSKVAIVSRSREPGCDIDYLFAQVGVGVRSVDLRPNCGNMLSGVVPFAIEQGLIVPTGDSTTVRVFNVNTGAKIDVTVCTPGGHLTYDGDTCIDGVAGAAAPVRLSFLDCWGSVTGKIFPTGRRIDVLDGTEATCIDAAMPLMILRAEALGITGRESPADLDANPALLARIEQLRRLAGERMGFGDVSQSVIPKPVLVSAGDDDDSITSRYFTPLRCHRSHAVTGAIGVATAFALPGTVASGLRRTSGTHTLAVLHPEGRIEVEIEMQGDGDATRVDRAALLRTARRIMHGQLTLPDYVFSQHKSRPHAARIGTASEASALKRAVIVVPTSPGGANDAIARLLARELGGRRGCEVRIDHRAGASGTIACQHVRRAAPDGRSLLLGYTATHAIHPVWENVGYDPVADFAPIGELCASPMVLVVRTNSRFASISALLEALARPSSRLRYAASGLGTLSHLGAELLGDVAGAELIARLHEGSAPALADVRDDRSDFMISSLYATLPQLRSGALHALCVSSGCDHALLAKAPSMRDVGLDVLDFTQWYGMFAPRGTPLNTLEALNADLCTILNASTIQDRLRDDGALVTCGPRQALTERVTLDMARWRAVIATLRAPMRAEATE